MRRISHSPGYGGVSHTEAIEKARAAWHATRATSIAMTSGALVVWCILLPKRHRPRGTNKRERERATSAWQKARERERERERERVNGSGAVSGRGVRECAHQKGEKEEQTILPLLSFCLCLWHSRLSQGAKKENRRNREDFIEVGVGDTRDAAFGSPAPGVCSVFDEEIDVRLVQLRLESTPLAL